MKRFLTLVTTLAAVACARYFPDTATWHRPQLPWASTISTNCDAKFVNGKAPTLPVKLQKDAEKLCYTSFAVLHSPVSRTPLWAAEVLGDDAVKSARQIDRASSFEPDTRLQPSDRAELSDYLRSGYDRGHLAPSGDMPDHKAQAESFYLSNIVPQAARLNRGSWADLESSVRDKAVADGRLYIVTGVLFQGASVQTTPSGRVIIPSSLWKAIASPGHGAIVKMASNSDDPQWRSMSLAEFQAETGIDPFPGLDPDSRKKKLNIG